MWEAALNELEVRIAETAAELERAVRAADRGLTGDGRVKEEVAAELIGMSRRNLRRLRSYGLIEGYRCGGRVTYRLTALAAWIEKGRDDDE